MDGLFALGSNGSGQLGLGHKEDVFVPKQVDFSHPPHNDPITQVAAGGNHTILVTASGKAYWSGDYTNGSCGVVQDEGRQAIRPVFRPFLSTTANPPPVTYVTCTWDTAIVVVGDENGRATRIHSYGPAEGVGKTPGPIPEFPPLGTTVSSLAAGLKHVVVVLDNGDVYGWGNGKKGQLGQLEDGNASGIVTEPRKIDDVPFKVAKVVCCQYTTCLIAEPGDGRILVLGADKWRLKSQAPIEVPSWKMMTASWGGIYILKRDGTLVAWGRDDHGQLPPPGLPEVSQIAAGSEHVIALTEAGDVLAWGWGEHGNCGPHTEGNFGDVRGRWNVLASLKNLPEGSSITAIGAGCATSWINILADGVFL
ncbi:RCC1/BLIP-II [Nemania sp. FL0916]|nr:RCC1/BLIP-II [Nemania sp. FL0916]